MQFEFMGAFRAREGDDEFSRHLRVLRAAYYGVVAGAFWLMGQTAWLVEYQGRPPEGAVIGAVMFSILTLAMAASSDRFRRPYALPIIMLLLLTAGEATALLGWWGLDEVLAWWRGALLLVAAACVLLWAGEKTVQSRRARREDFGSLE